MPGMQQSAPRQVRAFRDALVSPKPHFVRHGNSTLAATAMGALTATIHPHAPSRTPTLDPEVGIDKLAADLQHQEVSRRDHGGKSGPGQLDVGFSDPVDIGVSHSIDTVAGTSEKNLNGSPESSPTTMYTARSHSAFSMHSMVSPAGSACDTPMPSPSSCASVHGVHTCNGLQGPAAVGAVCRSTSGEADGEEGTITEATGNIRGVAGTLSPGRARHWLIERCKSSVYPLHTRSWFLHKLYRAASDAVQDGSPTAVDTVPNPQDNFSPHALDVCAPSRLGVSQAQQATPHGAGDVSAAAERVAPGKVAIQNSWKVLTDLFPNEVLAGAKPVAFVSNHTTHTQAWVHCNWEQSTVRCFLYHRPCATGTACELHNGVFTIVLGTTMHG